MQWVKPLTGSRWGKGETVPLGNVYFVPDNSTPGTNIVVISTGFELANTDTGFETGTGRRPCATVLTGEGKPATIVKSMLQGW